MNIAYTEFLRALKIVETYKSQVQQHLDSVNKSMGSAAVLSGISKDHYIYELEALGLAARTVNVLNFIKLEGIEKNRVRDFEGYSLNKLKNYRNVGEKTFNEIMDLFAFTNVKLSK